MNDIIQKDFSNKDVCFFDEYVKHLANLSGYNIGGVQLHLLAASSWFVGTNCELLGGWFAEVLPNGTYVEGTTEHYREIAKQEKEHYKWPGFHVWIEYKDEATGREKVLDPCSHMVYDKKYFYESEKAEICNLYPCSEVSKMLEFRPSKNLQSNEFDEFRFAYLINTLRNFTTADFGLFKNQIDDWAKDVESLNELDKRRNEFEEKYLSADESLMSIISLLFTDNVLFEGPRFDEQNYMLSQMVERLEDLKARGYTDEEDKLRIPDKKIENGKQKNEE